MGPRGASWGGRFQIKSDRSGEGPTLMDTMEGGSHHDGPKGSPSKIRGVRFLGESPRVGVLS